MGKRFLCRIVAAAFLAVGLAWGPGHASAKVATANAEQLRVHTREDILAAYLLLTAHHPGMYNPLDSEFAVRLEAAKDEALIEAEEVETSADRFLAVEVINRALADGHARVQIAYSGGLGDWPGFRTDWRGDGLYVTSSGQAQPSRGAKLLSCDGAPARPLIEQEVFRVSGRPGEAGRWWQSAGRFFFRGDLSIKPAPEFCTFETKEGHAETVGLNWQPYPREEFFRWLEAAQPKALGIRQLENGLRWITLSSFSPGAEGLKQYDEIFAELKAQQNALANDRAIVLDLRGNNGGSSTWSFKIAEHLWGEQAVAWAQADYFRDTEVWYLADQGNISHFGDIAIERREAGLPEIAVWASELRGFLSEARAEGATFYKIPFGKDLLQKAEPTEPRSLPPVYVITDGGCTSACLDAVDIFTRFEGVKLVGAPTSADTEYLEIRREMLPSGRGSVILPTKIWVNRPRQSGQVYHPDLLVTDMDWTTDTMIRHILHDLKDR